MGVNQDHLVLSETTECRLCGGLVSPAFEKTILRRYRVTFYRCQECGSLQSERPYWLEEAYSSAIASADTGAAYRGILCSAAISVIARTLRVRGRFLDYGGGSGLLCRLLRDRGFDAYVSDKYADPVFAKAFVLQAGNLDAHQIALISAIEVFEHCVEPVADLDALFRLKPAVLVATTIVYRGEGPDWWYISEQSGQHIFFYSEKALRFLAVQHGYHYLGFGSFHVFSRLELGWFRRTWLRIGLSQLGLRALTTLFAAIRSARYSDADFGSIVAGSVTAGDTRRGK